VVQQPSFNTIKSDSYPSIAIDHQGAIYTEGVTANQSETGPADIVIFKLEPTNGQCQWVVQQPSFNTNGINIDPTIAIDHQGSIYVAYYTNGTASGQTQTGAYDIVVFKLASNNGQYQ
jgi:hypothetical protein